jgi:peptidoglycan/xylan/chitin deacetylase (PgdA/CDA1 family)
MSRDQTVFLMYHELERPGRPTCRRDPGYLRYVIPEAGFRDQLDHLRAQGFRGLSVGAALAGRSAPQQSVVITFDDGCETDLLIAAPLLQEHGFGATFYVVAGFVGRPGFLAGAQVRRLAELGFEVGCHSMTHPYLTDLDDRRLRVEVVEAKDRLEQLTGRPVGHFSCPGGRWDERVARLARESGYVSVATSRVGANTPVADRFCLARVAVQQGTSLSDFDGACRGRQFWRRRLKGRVLASAKRLAGNTLYESLRAVVLGRG